MKFHVLFTLSLIYSSTSLFAAEQQKVLVFGGTGALGHEIVSDLLETQQYSVSVFARHGSDIEGLSNLPVDIIIGDILIEETVKKALHTVPFNIIIDALARDSDASPHFYEQSMASISKWSNLTGVSQIILHGSVGAGLSRGVQSWTKYTATIADKDRAERYLIESGITYTIIRHLRLLPAKIKESGLALLTRDQLIGGTVTRDGLARLTIQCITKEKCMNEIFHAYDPSIGY
jgi:uncharacterized protein YbjT (DUF2867 family)